MNRHSENPSTLPFAPAAERNRAPIQAVLEAHVPEHARILEIGAGTGQHAVAFSRAMPTVNWLATDRQDVLPGLRARIQEEGPGMPDPVPLDVSRGPWPFESFDAVFTANTCHIMPWEDVCAMVKGVAQILMPEGVFLVYGPFMRAGGHTSPGNERFDRALRDQEARQGIRALEALETEAARHQLLLDQVIEMPANNLTLVFRRHD